MTFAFETPEDWQDQLRHVRDKLVEADYAEPERKYLRKVALLSRYAERAAHMTHDGADAARWYGLAVWAESCHEAYLDALWEDRDRCICGGEPDPETWDHIDWEELPNWWDDAEKRIEAMDVVGDGKIREVIWCEKGGDA